MTTPYPSRLSLVLFAVSVLSLPALADSQARIVRLSDVQGPVQIDKNTGLGFENAFINLPITQGTHLRTGATGRAEVEFEDGSSMRLTPNTTVEFSEMGLSDSGQRISEINLVEGMMYVDWLGKDDLTLNFSREKLSLDHSARFRVDTSTEVANLAVFKGDVEVEGPNGKLAVEKKKTATFDAADDDKSTIVDKIVDAPLDSWDKEAVAYHDQYAKNNSSPYGYGVSDLNYYGAYTDVPGYGMMWQPFFTGVGWDPFMDGAWGWYPGFGYMFASAYPWGWMPYRYGAWMFIPGYGWGWQPGGWGTWQSVPIYRPTTLVHVTPLVAPTNGATKTVLVGKAVASTAWMGARYTVHAGSAGLGIPRGSINNLNHLNHQVAKAGFVQIHPAPQFAASSPNRSFSGFGEPHGSEASLSMGHISSGSAGHASAGGGGSHK